MVRRRRDDGLLATLAQIGARVPWWVSVGLALAAYIGFHALSQWSVPAASVVGKHGVELGVFFVSAIAAPASKFLQYIVPLALVFGSAVGALQANRRKALGDQIAGGPASGVRDLSWREFEHLASEAFRRQGYRVEETGGGGADGGVDLVLTKGGERFFVQCKQWRAFKVGVEVIRELYGVMAARGAAGGFVITSGGFTADAVKFAEGRNIRLVDGQGLRDLLGNSVQLTPGGAMAEPTGRPHPPICPVCGSPMVRRRARRGANAGEQFWGCTRYPDFRGTR